MSRELGLTYLSPEGSLVVVVEANDALVFVMVLQDNPDFKFPIVPGTLIPVTVGCAYWNESKLFSSDEEQGKVPS